MRTTFRGITRAILKMSGSAAQPGPTVGTNGAEIQGSPPDQKQLVERAALLEFAYKEVLDATKHQDDKIGRLITAIAFLTAASLALANFQSGVPSRHEYLIDSTAHLPLGLICLGVFLTGVVATVIMLVASLTTPLRLPGRPRRGGGEGTQSRESFPRSQFYFYEISQASLREWESMWESPSEDLLQERTRVLARETHNLATRTQFKYARTNEAVSVLTFSLLSFALSVLFVLLAAGSPQLAGPLVFDVFVKIFVAIFVGGYCWLQVRASLRYQVHTVDEMAAIAQRPALSVARAALPVASAAIPAVLILMHAQPSWPRWAPGVVLFGVPVVAWLIFHSLAREDKGHGPDGHRAIKEPASRKARNVAAILTALYAFGGFCFSYYEMYSFQLAAAYGFAVILLFLALRTASSSERKSLQDYRSRS